MDWTIDLPVPWQYAKQTHRHLENSTPTRLLGEDGGLCIWYLTLLSPPFPPSSWPVVGYLQLCFPLSSPCHFHPCPSFQSVSPHVMPLKPETLRYVTSEAPRIARLHRREEHFWLFSVLIPGCHIPFPFTEVASTTPLPLSLALHLYFPPTCMLPSVALMIFLKQNLIMSLFTENPSALCHAMAI